ncbi:MAG: 6-carboxytetrahydropterin synthase [bacterium]|nr:6-carboxytetrahydropterin synthase [bacterium]
MNAPLVQITHCQEFAAAHRLHSPKLSGSENAALYGPCNNLHGHNYRFEVTVEGPVDPATGMVMNLNDLAEVMRTAVWQKVDHKNLCQDVPFLNGVITTAENLAIAFWNQISAHQARLDGAKLHRIRVVESPDNFVDYFGGAQ